MSDEELAFILTDREFQDYAFGYRESVNDTELPHVANLPEVLQLLLDASEQLLGHDLLLEMLSRLLEV